MSYLFPVPAKPQRSLLDFKAEHGGVFSEDEATMDMMLMMDRGETKPERFLAKRWGWNPARVHRQKKALEAAAKGWREWNTNTSVGVKQAEAEVKQAEAKSRVISSKNAASEAEVKQAEAEVKQPLYIHPRASELDRTTELDKENSDRLEDLNAGASAPASSSPSFDLSFLSDRDLDYESDIRETLGKYRPTDARELLIHRWRRPQVPPMVTLADLLRIHGWEVFAAGVVISADTEKPRLPFLTSILQRLTTQRHEQRRQNIRPEAATADDQGGSGIPIYHIVPHAGEAVPRGVRTGRTGGHQPPRRNQGAYKRPGERSYHESLVAAGYTPEEIAALYPPDRSDIGPARLPDRGAHDDDAPLGVVVHLRNRGQQGAA